MTQVIQPDTLGTQLADLDRRIRVLETLALPVLSSAVSAVYGFSNLVATTLYPSWTSITGTNSTFTLARQATVVVASQATYQSTGAGSNYVYLRHQFSDGTNPSIYSVASAGVPGQHFRQTVVTLQPGMYTVQFAWTEDVSNVTQLNLLTSRIDVYLTQ